MEHINTVVQYRGGGYSGCFWEWNFGYFNDAGIFEDISSSGRNGCTTIEELNFNNDDKYFYDISTAEGLKEIQVECHIDHQRGLSQWIYDNTEFELFLICHECKNETDHDEVIMDGLQGCGGIAAEHNAIICLDCYSIGSCEHCAEYVGADELFKHPAREDTYGCKYCLDSLSRTCFDCGESEIEGHDFEETEIHLDYMLNKQRICPECAALPDAPTKGAKWHSREFNGQPVFVLA